MQLGKGVNEGHNGTAIHHGAALRKNVKILKLVIKLQAIQVQITF